MSASALGRDRRGIQKASQLCDSYLKPFVCREPQISRRCLWRGELCRCRTHTGPPGNKSPQQRRPFRSERAELLLVWHPSNPKGAALMTDAASDSAMLLFFPSALCFSSFSSSLKKRAKTQRNVLMAERSHITAQTQPH